MAQKINDKLRSWMTEQQTFVLTLGNQRFSALFSTRVCLQPRVEPWLHLLATEAEVLRRYLLGAVLGSALGTTPKEDRVSVPGDVVFQLLLELENRIFGPLLSAAKVKTDVTRDTVPQLVCLFD